MGRAWLLLRVSAGNVLSRRINLLIGMLILGATLLLVVGGAVLDGVEKATQFSITRSIAGDLQIYSSRSEEPVALYGTVDGIADQLPMDDFPRVKGALLELPNIKAVVPMGVGMSTVVSGNIVDRLLERLRGLLRQGGGVQFAEADRPAVAALEAQLRGVAQLLLEELIQGEALIDPAITAEDRRDLERALSDAFWAEFAAAPAAGLEFLENRIARIATGEVQIDLVHIGTDLDQFAAAFDRFQIASGEQVPGGRRGLLLSRKVYEDSFKLRVARTFDKLQEAVAAGRRIEGDPELQRWALANRDRGQEILLQLDPQEALTVTPALRAALAEGAAEPPPADAPLKALLERLLTVDDANIQRHHQIFYAQVAPHLELYRVNVGDMLTLKSHTRGGYVERANVRLYGTFQFKGLERAELANLVSLVDLNTFRELYGYVTPEMAREQSEIAEAVGLDFLSREQLEAQLDPGPGGELAAASEGGFELGERLTGRAEQAREALLDRPNTREELERGVVLNAAVLLEDPSALDASRERVEALAKSAGLPITVIPWRDAAGVLGGLVGVVKWVLYVVAVVIFVIILVIFNNTVMVVTMQRVRELGTFRAIGAHRGFVLSLVLLETALVGLVFGALAAALGVWFVQWLGRVGIPGDDLLAFFFSGPRLYPTLEWIHVAGPLAVVLAVCFVATLYPAVEASRVQPVRAMQAEE